MVRYICEQDEDRKKAGWGNHWWVIDTNFERPKALLFLLPEQQAKEMVDKLNGVPAPPRISMTRQLMIRMFGKRVGGLGLARAD